MIGGNTAEFGLTDERGLMDFYNIIPGSGGSGCEVCGMARTLDPVTNPDGPLCQAKQQVMGLEPKQETLKRPRVERQVAKIWISGTSNI